MEQKGLGFIPPRNALSRSKCTRIGSTGKRIRQIRKEIGGMEDVGNTVLKTQGDVEVT